MTAIAERLTGLEKEVDLLSAEAIALRERIATTWGRTADRLPSGRRLFTEDDGLLLLGADSDIWMRSSAYYWMGSRKEGATVSGALHWEPGRWPGTQAFMVEDGTTNLCTNPSFETGTANWSASGGSIAQSSDCAVFGSYSLKVTPTADVWDGAIWGTLSMTSGQNYVASVWFKGEPGIEYYVGLYDTDDASYVGGYNRFTATGAWQWIVTVGGEAVGNNSAQLWVRKYNNASTDDFYIDGVQIENLGCATSYCDGDQGRGYAWTGAAHGSTSYRNNAAVLLSDLHAYMIDGNTQYTFHAWVQPLYDSDGTWITQWAAIYDIRFGSDAHRTFFTWDHVNDRWALYINGGYRGTYTDSFSAGDWIMVDVTYDFDNDEYKYYVNGILRSTDTSTLAPLSSSGGSLGWGITNSYNGGSRAGWAVSEFAMLDRVLAAPEISVLYHNQRPLIDEVAFHKPVALNRHYYDVDNDRIYELTPNGLKYITLT